MGAMHTKLVRGEFILKESQSMGLNSSCGSLMAGCVDAGNRLCIWGNVASF